MANLAGAACVIVVYRRPSFGARPFVKDRKEAAYVLDDLPSILSGNSTSAAWLPQFDCPIN
jgi:hypothetical protein